MSVMTAPAVARAQSSDQVRQLIERDIRSMLPADGAGGAAVAVRINGQTSFFNFGMADLKNNRPVDSDSLFNLASVGKIFDATLLALAIKQGELKLDDPVGQYLPEFEQGERCPPLHHWSARVAYIRTAVAAGSSALARGTLLFAGILPHA